MTVAEMREALGLGPEFSDLAVATRWSMLNAIDYGSFDAEPAALNPWVTALDALFYALGSASAIYRAGNELPVEIRVIVGQPDRLDGFGRSQIVQASLTIEIRNSDVAQPVHGAVISVGGRIQAGQIIGGTLYQLFGEPIGDLEGLSHACGAELVREAGFG